MLRNSFRNTVYICMYGFSFRIYDDARDTVENLLRKQRAD